ncbi:hypothetical protein D9M72_623640 [compost metagenome]
MLALQIVVITIGPDDPLVVGAEAVTRADGALPNLVVSYRPACIDENGIAGVEHERQEESAAGSRAAAEEPAFNFGLGPEIHSQCRGRKYRAACESKR